MIFIGLEYMAGFHDRAPLMSNFASDWTTVNLMHDLLPTQAVYFHIAGTFVCSYDKVPPYSLPSPVQYTVLYRVLHD